MNHGFDSALGETSCPDEFGSEMSFLRGAVKRLHPGAGWWIEDEDETEQVNHGCTRMDTGKNSKHQAPTSREAPDSNLQPPCALSVLELGVWRFTGAWMLELGAFPHP
jgi:hypothetical protein